MEAIEILLQVMENDRDKLVVILAGYEDRMDEFFRLNPGMSSRIAHHIDFPDYTIDELERIAALMLSAEAYELSAGAGRALHEWLERRVAQPRFAHARSVRNAIERARLRHANRVYADAVAGRPLTVHDLMRIEEADIRASRVFVKSAAADFGAGSAGAEPAHGDR